MSVQADLPTLDGAAILGPVFVCIELPGPPGHKARHRSRIVFPRAGKPFIQNYPDRETAAYEKALAQMATIAMRRKAPTERPVDVTVSVLISVPKSWTKREHDAAIAGRLLPTSRPDGDNYLKLVDALNEIVWKDDAQIVDARVRKRYSASPSFRIEVREFVDP